MDFFFFFLVLHQSLIIVHFNVESETVIINFLYSVLLKSIGLSYIIL